MCFSKKYVKIPLSPFRTQFNNNCSFEFPQIDPVDPVTPWNTFLLTYYDIFHISGSKENVLRRSFQRIFYGNRIDLQILYVNYRTRDNGCNYIVVFSIPIDELFVTHTFVCIDKYVTPWWTVLLNIIIMISLNLKMPVWRPSQPD